MTKQEELEHINNLIELKVRSENLVAEKKGDGIVNTSEHACINPISNDLIQEEFVKIYNCQQPSLVVVPELNEVLGMASRNVENTFVAVSNHVSVLDILTYKNLVLTEAAVKYFEEVLK